MNIDITNTEGFNDIVEYLESKDIKIINFFLHKNKDKSFLIKIKNIENNNIKLIIFLFLIIIESKSNYNKFKKLYSVLIGVLYIQNY